MRHGFQLTAEMKEAGFSGGTIKITDAGHHFDIGEALKDKTDEGTILNHDKIIVVDDDILANILASYPGLEPVAGEDIPEDAEPVSSPRDRFTTTVAVMPPQFQTNDVPVGFTGPVDQSILLSGVAASEIPAEHADEPNTPEEAVAAGEAVSGGAGSHQGTAVSGYEMPQSDQPSQE